MTEVRDPYIKKIKKWSIGENIDEDKIVYFSYS